MFARAFFSVVSDLLAVERLPCAAVIRLGSSSVDVVDREVTSIADLSEGDVRRGYIVSAGSVGILIW